MLDNPLHYATTTMTEIERPKISCLIPIHDMENGAYFLWRNINSILSQSFKDYEIVISKEVGNAAHNMNEGMKRCRGEIIKILLLDDYFAHDDALQIIVDSFGLKYQWLATGCTHQEIGGPRINPHLAKWNQDTHRGNNGIGAPSVLAFRKEGMLLFDESLVWLVDCDLYTRYYQQYGLPRIVDDINVVNGLGSHQMTHKIADEVKEREGLIMTQRYG